jgi:aconitate hydratase
MTDTLVNDREENVKLDPPSGDELPREGFTAGSRGYVPPAKDAAKISVKVSPTSERLQILTPFPTWDGQDAIDLPVLAKVKGKCTTDHISPAGPWLKYRGHLDNISNNLFSGAVNAFTGEPGIGKNIFTGEKKEFAQIAREYKAQGLRWVVIGDENYGEGSSREHAAMEPRWLGGMAIIVKSFARIHETNLKKQGMLPLTFSNPADYEKVREDDRVSVVGLTAFSPGAPLRLILKHSDGSVDEVLVNHSFNENQFGWFKAGSALNRIAEQGAKPAAKRKKARLVRKGRGTKKIREVPKKLKRRARGRNSRRRK